MTMPAQPDSTNQKIAGQWTVHRDLLAACPEPRQRGPGTRERPKVITLTAIASLFICAAMVVVADPTLTRSPRKESRQDHLIRKAFVMTVNSGQEEEYARRHRPIWPELEATLRAHGVKSYTIFLLPETRQLFAYVEFDGVEQWNAVAQTNVCRKWWAHMKDVMPTNPDNSPVSVELNEVFHIEDAGRTPRAIDRA